MKQLRYRIYGLIDLETGEMVEYTPDLAAQVEELNALMVAVTTAQAQRDLFRLQTQRPARQLKPVPAGDGAEMAEALWGPLFRLPSAEDT